MYWEKQNGIIDTRLKIDKAGGGRVKTNPFVRTMEGRCRVLPQRLKGKATPPFTKYGDGGGEDHIRRTKQETPP